MTAKNPADPLKALLRERDLETLKKRFLGECLLRLQTLEGQVENYRSRLAFVEKRIERVGEVSERTLEAAKVSRKNAVLGTYRKWKQKRKL